MQQRLDNLKQKLKELWDQIRDSEAYQQVKTKYDELDGQTKLYIQLGSIGGVAFLILVSVLAGISKVNGLKNEIADRDELIVFLQKSADEVKHLRAQQSVSQNAGDTSAPLNEWAQGVLSGSMIDPSKFEVGTERDGADEKTAKEVLLDIKLNQVNLRQVVKVLFNLTDQGKARSVNIKDLTVDTKGDPTGYMDAAITVSVYRPK